MKLDNLFGKIDALGDLSSRSGVVLWLERTAFIFLTVMVLFAPHSIAVTQSAWLIGMLASVLRLFFKPRPVLKLTAAHYALLAFFLWSGVSSLVSYAPDISLDKLRGVSLLLIFYFVYHNLRTLRAARFLAFALVFSTMFAVLWTPLERIIGRGVVIYDFRGSVFDQIGLQDGDAILQIDGKKVNSLEEMRRRIFENPNEPQFKALIYRADAYTPVEIPRPRLNPAASAEESLGIGRWSRSHSWRAAGFYGHFTTFAEALQLIISLAFGIFIAVFSTRRRKDAGPSAENAKGGIFAFRPVSLSSLLLLCLLGMALALLLTVTRASQFAFLISSIVVVLLNGNRRIMLTVAALILPVAIVGAIVYQQTRGIGFDLSDKSTQYRTMMWRDGTRLWTQNAHNFVFGVGMDSIKRYWREWGLFDHGREPMGHFHSTPVQLVVERGLPALMIWLTILAIYARTLRRFLRSGEEAKRRDGESSDISSSRIERGIVLGCFGGLAGFFTSGLVHYNLGDGEVAMVFYLLMGISIFICNVGSKEASEDMRDIDLIIEKVKQQLPDADFHQLKVTNPNDDDGIWWFYLPELESEVHVESSYGMCPFIIETDEQWGKDAIETVTVDETVSFIVEYLKSKRNNPQSAIPNRQADFSMP